jgi:8-oxo-dGTP pyrophosphatase MutT (NUDIX family)
MFDDALPDLLKSRLDNIAPLRGEIRRRQRQLEPPLSYGRHRGPARCDARQASVVALLYPLGQRWHVALTRRSVELPDHAGQISLPGGVAQAGEDRSQCALREWQEEMGTSIADCPRLGYLSPVYVFVSNFFVHPLVACAASRPAFVPDPREVARVVDLPVDQLVHPHLLHVQRGPDRWCQRVPAIGWDGECIWGATLQILGELGLIAGECLAS